MVVVVWMVGFVWWVSDEFVVIVVWVVGFWYMVGLWLSCDMEFFFGTMGL